MRYLYVGQAGPKLLASSSPLTSASQSVGIIDVGHCAQPEWAVFNVVIIIHSELQKNLDYK